MKFSRFFFLQNLFLKRKYYFSDIKDEVAIIYRSWRYFSESSRLATDNMKTESEFVCVSSAKNIFPFSSRLSGYHGNTINGNIPSVLKNIFRVIFSHFLSQSISALLCADFHLNKLYSTTQCGVQLSFPKQLTNNWGLGDSRFRSLFMRAAIQSAFKSEIIITFSDE